MRLATRILLPPIVLLAVATAGGGAFYFAEREQEATRRADGLLTERATRLVSHLASDFGAIQLNLLDFRFDRRQARLDAIVRLDRSMASAIDAYAGLDLDADEGALLKAFIDQRNEVLHLRARLIQAIQSGDQSNIDAAIEPWSLQRLQVAALLDDLIGYRLRDFDESLRSAADRDEAFLHRTAFALALAFAAVTSYGLLVAHSVVRPHAQLLAGIERLARGSLDAHLDAELEQRRDEIGGLARAFNTMSSNLTASYRKLEAEIGERSAAQEALREARDALELRVRERTTALAQSNEALRQEAGARERAAVQLQRRNEELAQFTYIASHDLQEPLRMVTGYVQLLARRHQGQLDAAGQQFIGFAVEGAERMQSLIQDVLLYAMVEQSGRQPGPCDVNRALWTAIERIAAPLARQGGSVSAPARPPEGGASQSSERAQLANRAHPLPPEGERGEGTPVSQQHLPSVIADEPQLIQVFHALFDNALKFRGGDPPRITVTAQREGEFWRIGVTDNGIGIAAEYHERIFRIFQRLHSRLDYPGNGLGLALCRRIIERGGGRIWVESAPGRGATFLFTLPAPPEGA